MKDKITDEFELLANFFDFMSRVDSELLIAASKHVAVGAYRECLLGLAGALPEKVSPTAPLPREVSLPERGEAKQNTSKRTVSVGSPSAQLEDAIKTFLLDTNVFPNKASVISFAEQANIDVSSISKKDNREKAIAKIVKVAESDLAARDRIVARMDYSRSDVAGWTKIIRAG